MTSGMSGAALPGVSRTAVWVAGLRAAEDARPDRLFDDPYARAFVAAAGGGGGVTDAAAAGFNHAAATGWLAEGLLPYLPRTDSDQVLATVTALSAPGSRVVFDYLEATAADRPAVQATSDAVRQMGAQLLPTTTSPVDWLTEHGWTARLFRVPALGETYGRPLPATVDMVASNATALVTANR